MIIMIIIFQTITYLLWTAFFDFWENIDDEQRVRINGAADTLMSLNYAMNFYIHFIANKDIRDEVMEKIKHIRSRIDKILICK